MFQMECVGGVVVRGVQDVSERRLTRCPVIVDKLPYGLRGKVVTSFQSVCTIDCVGHARPEK